MSSRYLKCKNKTPRDEEYINAYLETKSQSKAAEICGVSRETVARAVRRADILMIGRKNNGKKQPNCKISESQLIEEIKTLNCVEIARKYNMSAERVYRRAKS